MGKATSLALREQIIQLYRSGKSYMEISLEVQVSYNTVRGLCKRFDSGVGLQADYSRCGRIALPESQVWRRRSIWLKRHHLSWGAPFIRLQLVEKYQTSDVPHERTLQKWFKRSGLNRPVQRHNRPKIGGAKAVHNIWQVDAKERFLLQNGSPCCYLNLVDEYSGGCIDAVHFPLSSNEPSSQHRGC